MQPEIFKNELASLIKARTRRSKPCIIALPVNQVLHKTLPIMPGLSTTELEDHIQREAGAVLPAKMTDIIWDYCFIPGKNEISVTLAQPDNVMTYVELFNACGLNLKVIDVDSYALARVWRASYPEFACTANLYGIALLRTQSITMALVHKQSVLVARSLPCVGSENVSSLLTQLISSLPLNPDLPSLKHVWLAGECATPDQVSVLENLLNIPVEIVKFGENFHGAAALDAAKLFLNIGIALWGKC